MSTTPDYARPVRLPRRSRQGIVMGLDGGQVTFLTIAALILLIAINQFGPFGLFYAAPLYLAFGVTALTSIRGISTPRMAGLWLSKHVRHITGATTHTFRPERPQLAGTLNLPGTRASIQLWDMNQVASAYNPHDRSVSVIAELEVQGFLMHELPERFDLAERFDRVLGPFTQRPGIKRVTLQERTLPTTIRAAREHYDTVRRVKNLNPESPVATNYQDVMDGAERFEVTHRNYLVFTLDLVALGAQLKALGGGKDAIVALASIEAGNLADALSAAKIRVRRWLSPRDVAALGRLAFDPEFAATVQNRPDELTGVDPIGIGPMFLDEPKGRNGIVVTDSGVHTTMWVHEWPRSDSPVGLLSPIVFARHPLTGEAITHILSIVLTPVPVSKALRRIRDEKKVWRGNEKLRALHFPRLRALPARSRGGPLRAFVAGGLTGRLLGRSEARFVRKPPRTAERPAFELVRLVPIRSAPWGTRHHRARFSNRAVALKVDGDDRSPPQVGGRSSPRRSSG